MLGSIFKKIKDSMPGWAQLASVPAAMIDRAYLNDDTSTRFNNAWHIAKTRSIYAGLFIPAALVDLIVAGLISTRYMFGTLVRADDVQDERLNQLKKYSTLFSKNLIALLSAPLGLGKPRLVVLTFLPEMRTVGVTSGGRHYHAPLAKRVHPESEEELINIIREAAASGKKIMVVGAGRSQGKQFLPEGDGGIVIDFSEPRFKLIEVDKDNKTVTVGAGATWSELKKEINKFSLALFTQQASDIFKVGGSVGTNIHGWPLEGFLVNGILEIEIITVDEDGNPEIIIASPDNNYSELFYAAIGGLGLMGIVTSVKLKLRDNELLYEKATRVEITDYTKHLDQHVLNNENVRMHLCRLSIDPSSLLEYGVSVEYVKEDDRKPCITPNLPEGLKGKRENRVLLNLAKMVSFARHTYWQGEYNRLMANNSPATTVNEIMTPPIVDLFTKSVSVTEWLQEFFLPSNTLAKFIKGLKEILERNQVILLNASIRYVPKHDKNPLSPAFDGRRHPVVICYQQPLQQKKLIEGIKWHREAQHLAVKLGGSYYLPYQHLSSLEDFQGSYPHARKFYELKQKYDPKGIFWSGFAQKYLDPSNKENHFKTIMATEDSKKEFSGFLNNVLQQVEPEKLYTLLADIMQYCDLEGEIYNELATRISEIKPSLLTTMYRILTSLSNIKADLTAQAKLLMPDVQALDGIIEIGYPGRFVRGLQEQFQVKGNIVAVCDGVFASDYIQTGFPRPYHQFQKLDYDHPDLSLSKIASHSASLVTCYVGLHHFPKDTLDKFLQEVHRVLRHNGIFLLVDHDVDNKARWKAVAAHMIFNVVTGVALEDEKKELRNFQPMSYWIELAKNNGLEYKTMGPDVPMIREGDSSMNRMVRFNKGEMPIVISSNNVSGMTNEKQSLASVSSNASSFFGKDTKNTNDGKQEQTFNHSM